MKKIWKRVLATVLTVSLISSFNMSKITFAEKKSNDEIAIDGSNFPDSIFLDYVKSNFDTDGNGKLSQEEISKVTYIYVNMKGIKDLKGIENFTNLKSLYAEVNYITNLDLSKNTNLVVVYCNNNIIESVKLPNETSNNKLEVLNLFDNRLSEINLSNLNELRYVNVGDNNLSALDLNVGKIESFAASYNKLTEIKLPNSGVTYNWKDLLATQLYHEETGYDFKWYFDSSKTQEVDPNKTPTIELNGQTIYSEYVPIEYTVEFKSDEINSQSKTQYFTYDEAQNLLKNEFTKEEYTFSGWKDSNGKIYSDEAEVKNLTTKKGANVVLTATWAEKYYGDETYKINLYDGESLVDSYVTNYTKERILPTDKVNREGYTFLGWSIGKDENVAYSDGESILMTNPNQLNGEEFEGVKSLNLYAVWKIKEFTVNFIDGENTYKNVIEYGKKVASPQNPTKEGYTFEGWITEEGENWDEDSVVKSDKKLYAKYSPITYSVSFNGNGGENTEAMNNSTINMDYSKQVILPTNLYEKTGYSFKGWSTSPNGNIEFADNDVIYQLTTENNKNITLYAIWEKYMAESTVDITTYLLNKVYDGVAVENPLVDKAGSTNEVILTWYEMVGSEWKEISSAPSNAGKYKVIASVEADDNYKEASDELEFEITKANPSYTELDELSASYGDKLNDIKLPEGFAWQDDLSIAVGNVGTNKFKITYTPEDIVNYEILKDIEVKVNVEQAINSWTQLPSIEGWEYGSENNIPVGEPKFGEVEFTYSNSENGTFTKTVPTEAGKWFMKATVQDNENYTGLEKVVSFVIEEKSSVEDKPSIDDDSNIGTPDNDSSINTPDKGEDDNITVPPVEDNKPTEDNILEMELPKLKENEVNEIVAKKEGATKFNIVLKDSEALKSGQGSLSLTLNDVNIKLPFSAIDGNLVDENDEVKLSLNLISDSEIVKDLRAVNKVFDFDMIINKENEDINIHNFKDGLAEITINLTDEEIQGLNKDKLKVYYYNEETKNFEVMESKVEGNNITFKTSHFSKYIIAEEIVDNTIDTPNTDNNIGIDNNNNNVDNPNIDEDNNINTSDKGENKAETIKEQLPETGSKVSSTTILVLAIGIVGIGGTMFFRKRKHA
ncbi:InlB B-repeat-containing protein [uncultured Clostridium sp.]|uniref:InlB B-repeat-containing protein n=1 Tax=uncultured Clostridium sp. TaxID=59620 RepID=UPI0025829497|nr:InlB B-repeat-containing protein [uncultured Clostridium sp.]